jgi:hypothetical protein
MRTEELNLAAKVFGLASVELKSSQAPASRLMAGRFD